MRLLFFFAFFLLNCNALFSGKIDRKWEFPQFIKSSLWNKQNGERAILVSLSLFLLYRWYKVHDDVLFLQEQIKKKMEEGEIVKKVKEEQKIVDESQELQRTLLTNKCMLDNTNENWRQDRAENLRRIEHLEIKNKELQEKVSEKGREIQKMFKQLKEKESVRIENEKGLRATIKKIETEKEEVQKKLERAECSIKDMYDMVSKDSEIQRIYADWEKDSLEYLKKIEELNEQLRLCAKSCSKFEKALQAKEKDNEKLLKNEKEVVDLREQILEKDHGMLLQLKQKKDKLKKERLEYQQGKEKFNDLQEKFDLCSKLLFESEKNEEKERRKNFELQSRICEYQKKEEMKDRLQILTKNERNLLENEIKCLRDRLAVLQIETNKVMKEIEKKYQVQFEKESDELKKPFLELMEKKFQEIHSMLSELDKEKLKVKQENGEFQKKLSERYEVYKTELEKEYVNRYDQVKEEFDKTSKKLESCFKDQLHEQYLKLSIQYSPYIGLL